MLPGAVAALAPLAVPRAAVLLGARDPAAVAAALLAALQCHLRLQRQQQLWGCLACSPLLLQQASPAQGWVLGATAQDMAATVFAAIAEPAEHLLAQ
jgi:hypothetical protein